MHQDADSPECQPPALVEPIPYAHNEVEQNRLWAVSKEATGAVFPWDASL